jgi:dolichol-phosphate mannosyltransferase
MNNPRIAAPGQRKLVSVVVPVYKNRETVAETCRRVLQLREQSFPHLDVEVVFVDDGSADGSWEELERVRAANPDHVSLVKLSRNFGQLIAILAGYKAAQGDAVITLSADLQDPVSMIAQMVSQWESGQEIVIAYRESRDDDAVNIIFSRIAFGVAQRANPRIPVGGFDYFLLSRRATDLMRSFKGRHRFFQGDILWLGLPTTFLPYVRERREHGKSGWTFSKKLKYFTDLILDSSYLPIRLMSALGFLTASAGLVFALVIVVTWLRNKTPFVGYAPIMITLLIVGGLIMMMLGIIGEYIWRIYDDVKEKPLYIVERQSPIISARSPQSPSTGTDGHEAQ